MVRMPFLLTILSAGGGATLLAQDTVVLRGVPSPEAIVATNEDGETMALHRLPTLLDPVVDSLKTEQRQAVAYLTYGPGLGRRHVRLAIAMSRVRARRVP